MPESETDRPSPPEQADGDVAPPDGESESDPTTPAPAECDKCGSLLPTGEEGLCAVCGTAFGFETSQMERVTPELLAELGLDPPTPKRPKAAPARAPLPEPPPPPPAPNVRRLAVVIGLVVFVLIGVLIALIATRG